MHVTKYNSFIFLSVAGVFLHTSPAAHGAISETTDFEAWSDWVVIETSIGFGGFASGTTITDQFESEGVLFTDGDDFVVPVPQFRDDWGLFGDETITLEFTSAITAIGVDFGGSLQIDFYASGELVYTSSEAGGVGFGFFLGVIFDTPIDRAVIFDFDDPTVGIDNLHFGQVIPTPGVLALGVLAVAGWRRRRR